MTEGNGTTRLAYWIMGALLGVVMLMGGAAIASVESRIAAVENVQQQRADTLGRFEGELGKLRQQICSLEEKVDNLREDLTHRAVYRRPCP